jgi:polyisoprenoid-binding protein YceI
MKKLLVLIAVSLAYTTTFAQTWTLDKAHAKLGFAVEHMLVSDVEGAFKSFDAKVTSSKEDFSDAVIELTADAGSVSTESEMRDNHIKGPDFFDVAKYPSLTFKSQSLKKVDGKKYKMAGLLTFHGVTKPVELDVTFNGTNSNAKKVIAGFKVTGSLKRSDFGIGNSVPNAVVGDEVSLLANVEFNKDKENP